MKVSAIYLDTQGAEYSCYVTRTDHGFMLATAHGLRPITFYIEGSDVAGGYVQFLDYRFERQPGLRVCDYFYSMNRLRAQLPWPQKPAQPPIPQVQPEDFRLHVEEAGDSFRVLQEAGARGEMEYRADRQRARQEMLAQLNQPDAQRIQDGRQYAAEVLHARKPRGKGSAFIVKSGE